MKMKLPDLKEYPSVLEFIQINEIFENTLNQLDNKEELVDRSKIVDFLIEIIQAQGYRPDENLREDLSNRVLIYLKFWWDENDIELCENITILSANLKTPGVLVFLNEKLNSTKNQSIQDEIIDTINEIRNS